jgi:hypothetical protein
MLPVKIDTLKNLQERRMIMSYINKSTSGSGESDKCVENIFTVNDDSLYSNEDNELFNKLHNHWMLWHGTKE